MKHTSEDIKRETRKCFDLKKKANTIYQNLWYIFTAQLEGIYNTKRLEERS